MIRIDTPENWDSASQGYSEKIAPFLMESFADEFIELLEVDRTTEALEVASGSGALTLSFAKKVKSLLATDFSPQMIEIVKGKLRNTGMENVSCKIMDGMALELEDNSVDRAACSFGLMLFPDRNRGFSELARVLKPGGRAMVSAWAGPDKFEALGIFLSAINQAFPDMPKPDAPPPVFSLANPEKFHIEMEAAGFKDVEVKFVSRDMVVESFEILWGMLTLGAPPVRLLFESVGEGGKGAIKESLQEIILNRFGEGPIQITNTATVGVGHV